MYRKKNPKSRTAVVWTKSVPDKRNGLLFPTPFHRLIVDCNQTRSPFSSFQKLANMSTAQEVIFIVALLSTINQFSYSQKLSLGLLNERYFPLRFQALNRKLPHPQLVMAAEGKTRFSPAPTPLLYSKDIAGFLISKKKKQLWNPGIATGVNYPVELPFNFHLCV